jgi:spermidine/putrescine-binding protein
VTRRDITIAAFATAACARDPRPRLNVFNWSDYIAQEAIPEFEAEQGVRVRYAVYESGEEMLSRVFSGNSGWDVVVPTNYFIQPMVEHRLLAPLDHARLTNLGHLSPALRHPAWDPELKWCNPYLSGATGIIFRRSVNPAPHAWASLWEERFRGRITMLDDPAEVIGACLMKLGFPLNSTNPEELAQARAEALAQQPLVRAYLNAEVRDQMVAGDVVAAQMWATTAQQAIDVAPELTFVYPSEGFARYTDCAVILRESCRAELAHRFLDYVLRPEVAARTAVTMKATTVNQTAHSLLPPEIRDNTLLYPPPDILARGQWFEPMPAAAQRLRDRIWTEIRAG